MKVAIIVLNYKGLKDTQECLQSLSKIKTDGLDVETIVIDNGSHDGSKEALSQIKNIKFIANDENLGYSGGNNVGIKMALDDDADWVLILNNDMLVDPGFLTALAGSKTNADILCPKIYFAPGYEYHKKRYSKSELGKVIWYAGGHVDWDNILGVHDGVDEVDKGQFKKPKDIDFATGAVMMVKREVFEKTGMFDEKFFLYLEDMDFCTRAKKNGFKIAFEPNSMTWHKNAGSSGGPGSELQDYYFTRNRLLFATKHAKLRTKLAVFKDAAKRVGNPTKRKALLDFLTLRFGKQY